MAVISHHPIVRLEVVNQTECTLFNASSSVFQLRDLGWVDISLCSLGSPSATWELLCLTDMGGQKTILLFRYLENNFNINLCKNYWEFTKPYALLWKCYTAKRKLSSNQEVKKNHSSVNCTHYQNSPFSECLYFFSRMESGSPHGILWSFPTSLQPKKIPRFCLVPHSLANYSKYYILFWAYPSFSNE